MGYRVRLCHKKCNSLSWEKQKNPTPKGVFLIQNPLKNGAWIREGLAWLPLPSSGALSTPTSPGGWPEVTVTELPGTCYYSSWGQSGEQGRADSSWAPIGCPLQGFSLIPSLRLPANCSACPAFPKVCQTLASLQALTCLLPGKRLGCRLGEGSSVT